MKMKSFGGLVAAASLSLPLSAAAASDAEVEALRQQMIAMQKHFDSVVSGQQRQIEALQAEVQTLRGPPGAAIAPSPVTPSGSGAVAGGPPTPVPADDASAPATKAEVKSLGERIEALASGQRLSQANEFNPSIGVVGDSIFGYRSGNSRDTGGDRPGGFDANLRGLELVASANVDPFTKAWAVANASADSQTNEASLGIEEAAIQTTALPGNLSLTAGRFFGEFGRLSYIHDHEMPFVNRPLVLDQYIGGESRTDGAQLNWLLPTERYLSLSFGAGSGFGGDRPASDPGGYRSARELSFWGRLSTYDDLNDNWQLETGLSAMATPTENATNDEATWTETSRHLAGIDMKLSYVPLENNQFQRFTWGNELLYSDNKYLFNPDGTAGSGDEYSANEGAFGLYSYVDYRWHRQWSGGFLFDYVQEAQDPSSQTFGYSPYLAYSISHWNQLRLQFTHTEHSGNSQLAPDNAIYLQWTWIIGAHEHGWQQR